jgi:hypothetical protein
MSSGAKVGAGKLGRGDGAFDLASYAPVAERITLFYETFPRGRIITELVSRTERDVVFRALVYRDASDLEPAATGWAAEREGDGDINTVACLENTETSAIGRALANLGFTASRERPSAEEMAKASRARARVRAAAEQPAMAGVYAFGDTRSTRDAPNGSMTDPLIADLCALITRAERAGLRASRAARWRESVVSGALSRETLLKCERRLRLWIHTPKRRFHY